MRDQVVDEIQETRETMHPVESRLEQLLNSLDVEDHSTSLVRLREKRRTHVGRATLCAVLPLYAFLRASLLEGGLLAVVVPVAAFSVFELWRAVSTHLRVRDSVRLLTQAEEQRHEDPSRMGIGPEGSSK